MQRLRHFRQWLADKLGAHLTRDEWLSAFRLGQASKQQQIEAGHAALIWRERQSTPPATEPSPLARVIGTEHLPALRKTGDLARLAAIKRREREGHRQGGQT